MGYEPNGGYYRDQELAEDATPEQVAVDPRSYTGRYLRDVLPSAPTRVSARSRRREAVPA